MFIKKNYDQNLNEEKDALEIFLLFQLRLPAFEKSSAHIQMKLAAKFSLKVRSPQTNICFNHLNPSGSAR